jgi:hypothetical protein
MGMKEQALLVTGLNKRMPDRKNKRIGFVNEPCASGRRKHAPQRAL